MRCLLLAAWVVGFFTSAVPLIVAGDAKAGQRQRISVPSTADGTSQPAYLIVPQGFNAQQAAVPLLVSLHSWSGDVEQRQPALEAAAEKRGWLYLFPDFRGMNDKPQACGSTLAQQDILDAVAWVCQRYPVDRSRIYLTGSSGGGHMTMLMAGRHPEIWAAASAWVGISDLAAWHGKHSDGRYGEMLRQCCGGPPGQSAKVDEQYRQRSPLTHLVGAVGLPLDLAAGVHDGHQGSVPIRHTLEAFNVVAEAQGAKIITEQEIAQLSRPKGRLEKPQAGDQVADRSFGRAIYLRRMAGKCRVSIFEGGHEGLPEAALAWLEQHRKAVSKAAEGVKQDTVSHPPLRQALPPLNRPRARQQERFVDTVRGDDANSGEEAAPWQSLEHAVGELKAGDTLYLRGGVYYEQVRVSLAGEAGKPITIRSYPGEQATIDGGLREFFESPQEAWEPYEKGAPDEYRSTRRYPNVRYIMGSFGDSMIGLNAYYHAIDLRAENEFWDRQGDGADVDADVKPVYCGPGIWLDPESGYLHARLAHTHLEGVDNYRGPTDPRRVPLVLADFRSVPLLIDGARHVRFQDLVIRGAGYDAVVADNASDVEFDRVTIWAGSYGFKGVGTQRLKLHESAIFGNVPPWTFRTETSLRTYPERMQRDITRLNTHALLVADSGREFSVYAFPQNDDWEIAHSTFADGHDGVYLGGIDVRFHHNLVEDTQDDGLYLSPMYRRYSKQLPEVHVYQNVIRDCLTALAFGGPELTHDSLWVYRNLIDLRNPVLTGRPSSEQPQPRVSYGKVIGDHGSPPWAAMKFYQNTVVMRERARTSDMALMGAAHVERPRHVFNNILLHLGGLPALKPLDATHGQEDANLYWGPAGERVSVDKYFDRYRASEAFEQSKQAYPPGFGSHSLAVDPKLVRGELEGENDYRLQAGSPAIDAGVPLPTDWPDPLREQDGKQPDIGWLPVGAKPPAVGAAE